jgi:hypothetical protein
MSTSAILIFLSGFFCAAVVLAIGDVLDAQDNYPE